MWKDETLKEWKTDIKAKKGQLTGQKGKSMETDQRD